MNTSGWIQLAIYIGALVAITKPLGIYLLHVLDPEREGGTFLERFIGPVERFIYRIIGKESRGEQDWKQYAIASLIFSLVTAVLTYGILRMQGHLPWHANVDGLS